MKIFIICSKSFYNRIPKIKEELEKQGHTITLPNCYSNPETESLFRGTKEHAKWKSTMIKHSEEVIKEMDAVLVLNYNKNGIENYIGGATFLEMYDAFRLNKKIYMINPIPENMLKDEIIGLNPKIIYNDLNELKENITRTLNLTKK